MTTTPLLLKLLLASATAFTASLPRHQNVQSPLFSTRFVDFDSSASKQAGAGPSQVDMNQYNIPLDQVLEEWTAKIVAKSANTEGGVKLFAVNEREILVDTVEVAIPRQAGAGMGILLQEIAGGREDGLGITVVSGLVKDGPTQGFDINEGDSIVKVSVVRNSRKNTAGVSDVQEEFSVMTECLGYDATVEAIQTLPVQESDDESYVVAIKRLRRKPKVTVTLQYPPSQEEPDETLEIFSGEILRQAMLVRGVKLNDVLAKRFDNKAAGNCGANGMCTTCAISVLRGGELLNPMRHSERQMMAANPRWRLACRSVVGFGMQEGEMVVRVNPRQWDDYVEAEK